MKRNIIKKTTSILALLAAGILSTINARAQSNTYVHSGASMYIFNDDTMSVWGNATNYGSWGSAEGGFVHFFGAVWVNNSTATMPGAGTFFFQQPRPAPYAADSKQYLEGGHDWSSSTGCSFPDIHLENANDLYLINNDSKVRDTFSFIDGHVIHDGFDFTVGDNDPGEILGYNETQFFVTNGTGTSDIGYLERENIKNTDLEEAYPIGIAVGDYTPGRVANVGTPDDFSMRVFANVYDDGYSGTTYNDASVTRTWDVEERTTGGSNATLELQHNTSTEGGTFASMKANHYITHFTGSAPNGPGSNGVDTTSRSKWDLLKYANLYAGESGTGYITTGSAISGALVTKRSNLDAFSPYTKTVYDLSPLPVTVVALEAQWTGEDAVVSWSTSSELNNSHFRIERSLDGKTFEKLPQIIGSNAKGGNSSQILEYEFIDQDVYRLTENEVLYRLVQIDFDGNSDRFGPVALYKRKQSLTSDLVLYPNPSNGRVTIRKSVLRNNAPVALRVINSAGQTVYNEEFGATVLESGHTLDLSDMPHGIYIVQLTGSSFSESRLLNIKH